MLLEDQHLDGTTRMLPGILGDHRVIDTVIMLGHCEVPQAPPNSTSFSLLGGHGALVRYLGHEAGGVADSRPLRLRVQRRLTLDSRGEVL